MHLAPAKPRRSVREFELPPVWCNIKNIPPQRMFLFLRLFRGCLCGLGEDAVEFGADVDRLIGYRNWGNGLGVVVCLRGGGLLWRSFGCASEPHERERAEA